jgi:hypothetical protein
VKKRRWFVVACGTVMALLVIPIGGCSGLHGDREGRSLQEPLKLELGKPGSPLGPVRVRSGQMIVPPRCCPPLELRDARGRVVQEFDVTRWAQPLVAVPGSYSLVGHDPAGEECVLLVEVRGK